METSLRSISGRSSITSHTPPVPIPPNFHRTPARKSTSSRSIISPCASDDIPSSIQQSRSFTVTSTSHVNNRREDRFSSTVSDDELADVDDDDSIAWDFGSSPPPLPLTPFKNQVGGHAAFLRFSDKALCKPLDTREQTFYEFVQAQTPELTEFMASYLGLVNVTFKANQSTSSDEGSVRSSRAWDSTPVIMLERNPHIFLDHFDEYGSGGEGLSSPASGDSFPGTSKTTPDACRHYNRKLQQQVFRDALSPKSLRARFSQLRATSQALKPKDPKEQNSGNMMDVSETGKSLLLSSLSELHIGSQKGVEESSSLPSMKKYSQSIDTSSSRDDSPHLKYASTESQAPIFHMSDDEDDDDRNSTTIAKSHSRAVHSAGSDIQSPSRVKQKIISSPSRKTRSADQKKVTSFQISQHSEDIGSGFNPWSLHLYQTKMGRLFSDARGEATHKFLLLEDLTEGLRSPCILDLKMGTRQYGVNATSEKKSSQERKCERSTSKKLGVRICGMQLYRQDTHSFSYLDKYAGRQINVSNFKQTLLSFLDDGNFFLIGYIPRILDQLKKLSAIVSKLPSYRFYGTSLLILYDGAAAYDDPASSARRDAEIRMIDFANCVTNGDKLRPRDKPVTPASVGKATFASTPSSLDGVTSLTELSKQDDSPQSTMVISPSSEKDDVIYVNYPPTTIGPDGGYLLGLQSLIANFEEIHRDLSFDPSLLDPNGHLPKNLLPNTQRAIVELGLVKQSQHQQG